MTGNIKLPIVASTIAAIFMSISAPVAAEPSFSTDQVRINVSDIDLSSARGQVKLQNRVDAAIHDLCGTPVFGTREEAEMLQQCRADARANAEPKVRMLIENAPQRIASTR